MLQTDINGVARPPSVLFPLATSDKGAVYLKEITFDGTAGKGAIGTISLWTPVGAGTVRIFVIGEVLPVSAGAGHISIGTSDDVALFCPDILATDLTVNKVWQDQTGGGTPAFKVSYKNILEKTVVNNGPIILTVATGAITAGKIKIYAMFSPIENVASLS